ncbi:hypothetical protein L7F22_021529 [Adiantum nelumboides]|nr:hypothetical protein [Adiantum nelumboides]
MNFPSDNVKETMILHHKTATIAQFVFSVLYIEGEGLDSLSLTTEVTNRCYLESKGKQSTPQIAGLPSLDPTTNTLLLTEDDFFDDGSVKMRAMLNMLTATKIILARSERSLPVIDIDLIKTLHSALFDDTEDWFYAGKYRKHSAFTITKNEDKHFYLSYSKIPTELNKLVNQTNEMLNAIFNNGEGNQERVVSLLKLGGAFFMRFEDIHPFHDGNGRVGRLLLAYILSSLTPFHLNSFYMDGQQFPTFVDRSTYLNCWEQSNTTRVPSDITSSLIIEGIYVAWQKYFFELD